MSNTNERIKALRDALNSMKSGRSTLPVGVGLNDEVRARMLVHITKLSKHVDRIVERASQAELSLAQRALQELEIAEAWFTVDDCTVLLAAGTVQHHARSDSRSSATNALLN